MGASIKDKIAVVTGANRGIGLEICRQLASNGAVVVLTSRDEKKGMSACEALDREELPVRYHQLDVDHAASISQLKTFLEKEFGRCDILVNNAGIFPDTQSADQDRFPSIFNSSIDTIKKALHTNVFGPLLMCQALIPLMKKNNYGRIVNISSGMGQLTDMNGGYPGYRISKTAVNALTRILNDELLEYNILVNSMCPGWVQTDMGGPGATRSVQEGADTAVWLANLPNSGPRGKFFRDRKEIPW
jgi:NAD(P)-dependent dehydrogenase (short-subunit alcohol dehydrogenase family)